MYLKKLEIKGFKSFADNTEIILNPGINVIVGPNGCGKSNIVDAIRWVLGESNVRHLRGQKTEDIIFNGTDKAKALGMASVEMTIDNSDGVLPVDYSEVNVARKVFRSGESEFLLNKSKVRMKDISSLFMGTGLGKKGYSIISQGELEQVLNGHPIDRRLILEEASGVIKYRQQRDEVKKRIAETGNDLLRLADLLTELRTQQGDLKVKADKAKEYISITEKLNNMEKDLLQYELSKALIDYNKKISELTVNKEKLNQLKITEKEQSSLLTTAEEQVDKIRQELILLKEQLHSAETNRNNIEGEIRLSEERVNNNQDRIETAIRDESKYAEMLSSISEEVSAREQDLANENMLYEKKNAEFKSYQNSLDELLAEISAQEKKFENEKADIFVQMENEAHLKNNIAKTEEELKRLKEKYERLNLKKDELNTTITNNRLRYKEIEDENRILQQDLVNLSIKLEKLNSDKAKCSLELAETEQQITNLENQIRSLTSNLASLKDMQEKLVGYSPAVKLVMTSSEQLSGIMGLVGEIIQVPEGLEVAIETATGRGLDNIIIDTSSNAKKVIDYLKKKQGGRITLLPLDILKVQSLPLHILDKVKSEAGVLGLASHLINYDNKFSKAIDYLLGRVLIVEDMDTGVKIFKKYTLPFKIVTLQGEIINTSGAMTGGSIKSNNNNSPLKRKVEEKKLTKILEEYKTKLHKYLSQKDNWQSDLNRIDVQLSQVKEDITEKRFKTDLLLKQMEVLKRELDSSIAQREEFFKNTENINQKMKELELVLKDLNEKRSQMQTANELVSKNLEVLRNQIDKKRRDYEVGIERLTALKDYLDTKEKELENIKRSVDQFRQVRDSYRQSMLDANRIKIRLTAEVKKEKERITELLVSKNKQEILLTNIKYDIEDKQKMEKNCIEDICKYKEAIEPLHQEIVRLEGAVHNLEVDVARLDTELASLKAKWQDSFYSEPPLETTTKLTPSEIRTLKSSVAILSKQIEEIGSVDPHVINEYEELSERVLFLSTQFEDLNKGKESLEKLLEETEKLMNKNFTQFFMLANESFKKTFKDIFGGGEAFLKLDTNGDRLEAGVDIEVKMPGKKLQSLSLLSGGERALTCIAFIFALLRLKPAPFCLLDEIDAALDETNLIRFSHFVKMMSDDIQFIIITHRQATIECGQNLYGVTMPVEGISSVLTLNLKEAESLAG